MGRINNKIEREQVLEPCITLCKKLLAQGHILQYRRLDVFDHTHIDGSPDIEIWLPKEGLVWVLMAECKKPVGGVLSTKQKEYRDKYNDFKNIMYEIITDHIQLRNLVFRMSDVSQVMNQYLPKYREFCNQQKGEIK